MYRRDFLKDGTLAMLSVAATTGWNISAHAADTEAQGIPLQIMESTTRAEAEQALREFRAGVSFRLIVREHSIHPTAEQSGYLGRLRRSEMRPEVRAALAGVAEGQVTDLIQTPTGFMFLRVIPAGLASEVERGGHTGLLALAVEGTNRQYTDVDGFGYVEENFQSMAKPAGFYQNPLTVCDAKLAAIRLTVENQERALESLKAEEVTEHNLAQFLDAEQEAAQVLAYVGHLEGAIKHFQAAYDIAASHGLREIQLMLGEQLGATELRRAQLENLIDGQSAEGNSFPIPPELRYKKPSGSEQAIAHFLKYLESKPEDLEVRWLLNIAYMTLGQYPQQVPANYVIPPETFRSEGDIGRFVDVAPSLGLNVRNNAGSVVVDDFDNDGFMDILVSDRTSCGLLHYFHNNGDGTFSDRTAEAGLASVRGGSILVQADYNNDGWMDFVITRGAWEKTLMPLSLMKNNGDGTFTDVTHQAGLDARAVCCSTAAWADYDNDGNIDLFAGSELGPNLLLHNNGDGTFTDVTIQAGLSEENPTKGIVAGDYDNDGYPDFYVSNVGGENQLFHNNHDGTFTDVAAQMHVERPIFSFPTAFLDYDNDGWLDIAVFANLPSVTATVLQYLKLPVGMETSKLYRNLKGVAFEDVSKQLRFDRMDGPMGFNFGDVDNDGYLDFFLGNGNPSFAGLIPHVMLRNNEANSFTDITTSSGTGALGKGHGIAFADMFNTGNQDIFAEIGGAVPGDKYNSALYKNPGNGNHWIAVKLVGVKTNRAAIGARIKVSVKDEKGAPRSIYRDVTSGGSFGASPLEQHVGLGSAGEIDSLEIWWPTSNTRQVFQNVAVDQYLQIKEFDKEYVKLNRRKITLGH